MALRQGSLVQLEQDRSNGEGPQAAYLMSDGSGGYVLGVGNKAAEATAFLKDDGASGYVLDDDSAEEDLALYLIGTNEVIA
jgi:hypothetical protein